MLHRFQIAYLSCSLFTDMNPSPAASFFAKALYQLIAFGFSLINLPASFVYNTLMAFIDLFGIPRQSVSIPLGVYAAFYVLGMCGLQVKLNHRWEQCGLSYDPFVEMTKILQYTCVWVSTQHLLKAVGFPTGSIKLLGATLIIFVLINGGLRGCGYVTCPHTP